MAPLITLQIRRSTLVITSSGVWRGTKTLVLKSIVDDGIKLAEKNGHKVRPLLTASRCV